MRWLDASAFAGADTPFVGRAGTLGLLVAGVRRATGAFLTGDGSGDGGAAGAAGGTAVGATAAAFLRVGGFLAGPTDLAFGVGLCAGGAAGAGVSTAPFD